MGSLLFTVLPLLLTSLAFADDQVDLGRQIAEEHCASCHAIAADDASDHPEAVDLRDLSQRYPVELLETALVEGLFSSHPDMPTFVFDPIDAQALLAYLATIQSQ